MTLRPLTERDIPMLHRWLSRPHVVEWWGGDDVAASLEAVADKYLPRLLPNADVTSYIGMLGDTPIGYAQSYAAFGAGGGWWKDETDPGVRGIDQFLCDEENLGKGLGTRMAKCLVDHLFLDPSVTRIQADPSPRNARAIRCYEKAGFRAVKIIQTPDGDALYMVMDRPLRECT